MDLREWFKFVFDFCNLRKRGNIFKYDHLEIIFCSLLFFFKSVLDYRCALFLFCFLSQIVLIAALVGVNWTNLRNCVDYWGCRIHQVHWVFWIWHKAASDAETPVLELWGIWGSPSLLLPPILLWPKVVVPLYGWNITI